MLKNILSQSVKGLRCQQRRRKPSAAIAHVVRVHHQVASDLLLEPDAPLENTRQPRTLRDCDKRLGGRSAADIAVQTATRLRDWERVLVIGRELDIRQRISVRQLSGRQELTW